MRTKYKHSKETRIKISQSLMGHGFSKESLEKMSKTKTGSHHTEESKKKISKSMKGLSSKWLKGRHNSPATQFKKGMTSLRKGKLFPEITGMNHWNWKGGYENRLFHNRKRRMMKKNVSGSHTLEQWQELKKKYNYMCLCCKKVEPFITLTQDHITPISKGGNNDISNIQPLCARCNCQKYTEIKSYL